MFSRALILAPVILAFAMAPASARTLQVGADQQYKLPSTAIHDAKDGDTIDIAPGIYVDCAYVTLNNLTIEGTGPNATAVMADKACAGKGLLITAGHDITIRNITLRHARVPDNNGAGIRIEGTNLLVDGVHFIDNQDGMLGGPPDAVVTIRNSDFEQNGVCNPICAHGIYISAIKSVHVEHSRFFENHQGHHIKSRAARTEIIGCDIEDGPNGTTSYLIDIPNGGSTEITGNTLEKGPKSQNQSTAISIGEEGVTHPTDITITDNSFRNDGDYDTTFLTNRTSATAILKNNKLTGKVLEQTN